MEKDSQTDRVLDDDETFIAAYVAKEAQRINERLKRMVTSGREPGEEERAALSADIDTTLSRMRRALMQLEQQVGALEDDASSEEWESLPDLREDQDA